VSVAATGIAEKLRYRCVGGGAKPEEAIAFQILEPVWSDA